MSQYVQHIYVVYFLHVHIMYIRYFTLCMIVIVYAVWLMYGGCSRATLVDPIFFLGS